MSSIRHDLKHILRRLAHSPALVAAVVLSIGLGIAANATIFSMASRFVLRPAPVGDPAGLLALHTTDRGECCNHFSWPLFTDLQRQSQSFSSVAAYHDLVPASIGGRGEPARVWGQTVTSNFFAVAQLGMTVGRGFSGDEEHLPVIVLGHRLWQRRFASDPAIVGKSVNLSGHPFTIVGVAPPAFRGLELPLDPEFWVTLGNTDRLLPNTANYVSRNHYWLSVIGRLQPGATRAQANAELNVFAQHLAEAHPDSHKYLGFRFETAGSLPPKFRSSVLLFLGTLSVVVLLVLAIACANVTNLLLSQVSGRQKELAVRLALGATRSQLMRQLLTESVLLSFAGGLFGVVLSLWGTQALSSFHLPAPIPLDLSLAIDWRVLLFTLALSVGSGLLFGVAPAWAASRTILSSALKGEDLLARPGRRFTLRSVLIVAQIAMSVVLLCATGLFLRSLQNASRIDLGFGSHEVLMLAVDPQLHGYSAERTTQFLDQLRQRIAMLPGVASVAATDVVPLSGGTRSDSFTLEGHPPPPNGSSPSVDLYMATSGYFQALGIPLVAGRDFAQERATDPKVAVVSESFAKDLFGSESPIGQRVSGGGVTYEIIGVAKNIKSRTLGEQTRPVLYRSLAQSIAGDPSFFGYSLVVRSAAGSSSIAAAVRREILAADPNLAIYNAETMEEHLRNALFLPRLAFTLFGIFGFVGLVLAAVGLYGVISYSVSQRTCEIGVRMALGAQVFLVQRLIVVQGMRVAALAIAIGLAAAFAVSQLFACILYGVRAHDPATFMVVPLFLAVVALLATWLPARRASTVDPLTALRHD